MGQAYEVSAEPNTQVADVAAQNQNQPPLCRDEKARKADDNAYDFIRTLSEGSYGDVHECLHLASGHHVAIKRFKTAHQDPQVWRLAMREIKVLRHLPRHPYIIQLHRAVCSQSSGRLFLVFELMERSLLQELRRSPGGTLPAPTLKLVAWQLLQALAHCHDNKVVHRDVKPANVLISKVPPQQPPPQQQPQQLKHGPNPQQLQEEQGMMTTQPTAKNAAGDGSGNSGDGHDDVAHRIRRSGAGGGGGSLPLVKLCDFGFARWLPATTGGGRNGTDRTDRAAEGSTASLDGPVGQHPAEEDTGEMSDYVVTRWYRAPEVLISHQYGTPVDIWSYGCTLAELATGAPLFPGSSSLDQLWRITRCLGPLPPAMVCRMRGSRQLAAMAGNTERGRTLAQRIQTFDRQLLDLLAACLTMDPRVRPTARQLLRLPYFAEVPYLLAAAKEGVMPVDVAHVEAPKASPTEARPLPGASTTATTTAQMRAGEACGAVQPAGTAQRPLCVAAGGGAGLLPALQGAVMAAGRPSNDPEGAGMRDKQSTGPAAAAVTAASYIMPKNVSNDVTAGAAAPELPARKMHTSFDVVAPGSRLLAGGDPGATQERRYSGTYTSYRSYTSYMSYTLYTRDCRGLAATALGLQGYPQAGQQLHPGPRVRSRLPSATHLQLQQQRNHQPHRLVSRTSLAYDKDEVQVAMEDDREFDELGAGLGGGGSVGGVGGGGDPTVLWRATQGSLVIPGETASRVEASGAAFTVRQGSAGAGKVVTTDGYVATGATTTAVQLGRLRAATSSTGGAGGGGSGGGPVGRGILGASAAMRAAIGAFMEEAEEGPEGPGAGDHTGVRGRVGAPGAGAGVMAGFGRGSRESFGPPLSAIKGSHMDGEALLDSTGRRFSMPPTRGGTAGSTTTAAAVVNSRGSVPGAVGTTAADPALVMLPTVAASVLEAAAKAEVTPLRSATASLLQRISAAYNSADSRCDGGSGGSHRWPGGLVAPVPGPGRAGGGGGPGALYDTAEGLPYMHGGAGMTHHSGACARGLLSMLSMGNFSTIASPAGAPSSSSLRPYDVPTACRSRAKMHLSILRRETGSTVQSGMEDAPRSQPQTPLGSDGAPPTRGPLPYGGGGAASRRETALSTSLLMSALFSTGGGESRVLAQMGTADTDVLSCDGGSLSLCGEESAAAAAAAAAAANTSCGAGAAGANASSGAAAAAAIRAGGSAAQGSTPGSIPGRALASVGSRSMGPYDRPPRYDAASRHDAAMASGATATAKVAAAAAAPGAAVSHTNGTPTAAATTAAVRRPVGRPFWSRGGKTVTEAPAAAAAAAAAAMGAARGGGNPISATTALNGAQEPGNTVTAAMAASASTGGGSGGGRYMGLGPEPDDCRAGHAQGQPEQVQVEVEVQCSITRVDLGPGAAGDAAAGERAEAGGKGEDVGPFKRRVASALKAFKKRVRNIKATALAAL